LRTITKPLIEDHLELLTLWEESVRATHDFLGDADILAYKKLIGDNYLQSLNLYCIRSERGISGFIGLSGKLIQMLFVHPHYMNQGIGRALVNFAISKHKAFEVDVNEQNTNALKFYKSLGFEAFDRYDTDDAGKPFPILSLSLNVNR
jgi:putative acetyltransferase